MLPQDEYRTLVEQAPVMLWRCDASGARDYCNARWLAFTGRTLDDERGDGWVEVLHTGDIAPCLTAFRRALEAGRPFELEYRLRRSDGQYRWVFERAVPLRDEQGRFAGFVGSCVDVTARILAEREAAERGAVRTRELLGLLPICSGCHEVREDGAYWHEVKRYVTARSEPASASALCPQCRERLLPSADPER